MAYPMKNIPAPNPKAVALRPRSSLIVSFAKPTLFRSRNAMKYRNTISGNTRRLTLRIVRSPNSPSDSTDVRDPGIALSNHEGTTTGTRNTPRWRHKRCGRRAAYLSLRFLRTIPGRHAFSRCRCQFRGRHRPKAGWLFQLPIRQLLGVRHVKGPYAPHKGARSRVMARLIFEARLRRRQVFPGSKGHRSGEEIRGRLHGIGAGALSSPVKSMLAYSRSLSRR